MGVLAFIISILQQPDEYTDQICIDIFRAMGSGIRIHHEHEWQHDPSS